MKLIHAAQYVLVTAVLILVFSCVIPLFIPVDMSCVVYASLAGMGASAVTMCCVVTAYALGGK